MKRWLLVGSSLLVACALLLLCVRHAQAALAERMLQLATPWMQLAGIEGDEHRIELNGAELHVMVATVTADISAVLDRFETICDAAGPQLAAEFHKGAPTKRQTRSRALRRDLGDAGVAVCLAQPTDARRVDIGERIAEFLRSKDVASLGRLRYLVARRTPSGSSQVVLAYSNSSLRLLEMFPARGDASGSDLTFLPRPKGGRRLLSALVSDDQTMLAYAVQGPARDAIDSYLNDLGAHGYRTLPVAPERGIALALKGSHQILLHGFQVGDDTIISAVTTSSNPDSSLTESVNHVE